MLPEARILDLHDLLSDLSDDLLAPPVCLDQIMALRGQIRPLLLRASGVICAQAKPAHRDLHTPHSDAAGTQGTKVARLAQ